MTINFVLNAPSHIHTVILFHSHFVPSHFPPSVGPFVPSNTGSHFVPKKSHFFPKVNQVIKLLFLVDFSKNSKLMNAWSVLSLTHHL